MMLEPLTVNCLGNEKKWETKEREVGDKPARNPTTSTQPTSFHLSPWGLVVGFCGWLVSHVLSLVSRETNERK